MAWTGKPPVSSPDSAPAALFEQGSQTSQLGLRRVSSLALGLGDGILDGQIASIAWAKSYAVATRNVRDFAECGVDIINPFEPIEARLIG